jgi:hypothetical protein
VLEMIRPGWERREDRSAYKVTEIVPPSIPIVEHVAKVRKAKPVKVKPMAKESDHVFVAGELVEMTDVALREIYNDYSFMAEKIALIVVVDDSDGTYKVSLNRIDSGGEITLWVTKKQFTELKSK